jgi:hypothetical protein
MRHTIYFKIPTVKVKIECESDEALNYVMDDMLALDGKVITAADFDEEKVFNILNKGESIMHVMDASSTSA